MYSETDEVIDKLKEDYKEVELSMLPVVDYWSDLVEDYELSELGDYIVVDNVLYKRVTKKWIN